MSWISGNDSKTTGTLVLCNIFRLGGPYREKLCQRSWVRPEAAGRGPYPRPRAQFFPIRTDLGRQITCLLFSSVGYFVSSFWIEFSLQPFSNLVYACVWHLGNRKSNQHYTHWRKLRNWLFLRSLFTFYDICSEKKPAGSGWENPDRWSALNQPIRFKDLGFRTAQMHEKIIIQYIST